MKLVFVNITHPQTPHVSGMRLFCFATAMSKRGHKVVLLTGASPGSESENTQEGEITALLESHDWAEPMLLPIAPASEWRASAATSTNLPSMLRKMMTAWQFLVHGGVFSSWTKAAKPAARVLAANFQPDLVWATFGNTSNLTLGQYLARRAGCPWIPDIKDNWSAFVPFGLRRLMAHRFKNASALTSNAEHHLDIATKWIRKSRAEVVYSGVAESFYRVRCKTREESAEAIFLLVGSIYSSVNLDHFLTAFKQWRNSLADGMMVKVHYAGSDSSQVLHALNEAGLTNDAIVQRQLSLHELADQVHAATAVCYLWASFGFHHKLMELLVAGTPIIAFPGEHPESLRLASNCATPFYACSDRLQLKTAFDKAMESNRGVERLVDPPAWRWIDISTRLERLFTQVLAGKRSKCVE